jgi:hypothetical protein
MGAERKFKEAGANYYMKITPGHFRLLKTITQRQQRQKISQFEIIIGIDLPS